jgi:excisionase family DNA binding protein
MGMLSVAQAARHLGVGVPRIHQRIADGSLPAERIGSQWVVDERALLRLAERKVAGRPLSARSAWAIIALAAGDEEALAVLAPSERSRARARLDELLSLVEKPARSEQEVRRVASVLRLLFRNRAGRLSHKAALADLPRLREDPRWQAVVDPSASGVASFDVDGYLAAHHVDAVVHDYLLLPVDADANVVIHVLPEGQKPYVDSPLRVAVDLADERGPREELRAAELLHQVAVERQAMRP